MHKKKLLFLALAVGVSSTQAQEIKLIRFGKTLEKYRVVIESDEKLEVREQWVGGHLELEFPGLTQSILGRSLTRNAQKNGVVIQSANSPPDTKIILPITHATYLRKFHIAENAEMRHRLVIDWQPSLSTVGDSVAQSSIEKPPAPVILPTPVIVNPSTSGSAEEVVNPSNAGSEEDVVKPTSEVLVTSSDNKVLRDQAEKALTDEDYRLAISLLNTMLKNGNSSDKEFAAEYLGVAHEKNQQQAFAKQYYLKFLAAYPESSNIPRVKQRLNALIGIQNIGNNKTLSAGSRSKSRVAPNTTRGSISTAYRRSDLVNDLGDRRKTNSLSTVDLDIRGDYSVGDSSLRLRLSGGHDEDLLDGGVSTNERLRYANLSLESPNETYRIDFGRMRSSGKGIFSRFDGGILSYGINDSQRINLVGGYPVASTKDINLNRERVFVGLSYDYEDILPGLDFSLFAIDQTLDTETDKITDRQAVGGEIKYIKNRNSIYALWDYDVFFNDINALLISGSHTAENKTRYHWSLNQRKSPYISTRNALIGQAADSIAELQDEFITEEEILDLAFDRSLESKNATFQVSKPINERFNFSTNLTWLSLSDAPASGGVPRIEASGDQVYVNLYIGANKLFSDSDSTQFGTRISSLTNANVWSVFANSRYRWSPSLSTNFKIRYDDRTNIDDSGQNTISPGFRLQFQNRHNLFYTEIGAILFTNQVVGLSEDLSTDIYYGFLGYQYNF